MAELICPQCHTPNRDTARYCADCGAPLLPHTTPRREPPQTTPPQPGMLLEQRYRVEAELGRGGFGAVFKAWDQRLSKPVALKENLDASPEAARQFAREAMALANLSHPFLPRVIDHFTIPGQGQYLVMDFVEGQDLNSLIDERGALPVAQAAAWIEQVAEALEYLHSQQPAVLHRDIKPANIRISPRGQAILVDFGLVKFSDPTMKTTIGARAVTPGYAPPEQYGIGNTDARSDLYALGATLFRALTGRDPLESVQRMAGDDQPLAHHLNADVSPTVSQVVDRAMQLDPARRFQSAAEFRQALHAAVLGKGSTAQPTPPTFVVDNSHAIDRPSVPRPAGPPSTGSAPSTGPAPAVGSAFTAPPLERKPVSHPPADAVSRPVSTPVSRPLGRPGKTAAGLGGGLILALCLIGGLGAYALISMTRQANAGATQTVQAQATAVMQMQGTITAQAQMVARQTQRSFNAAATQTQVYALQGTGAITRTASAPATLPGGSTPAVTALNAQGPTMQALNVYLPPDADGKASLAAGPLGGQLAHNPANSAIETIEASGRYANFLVESRFYNPYTITRGDWDYGFLFRYLAPDDHYRLIIASDGNWSLRNRVKNGPTVVVKEGRVTNLKTGDGEANTLTLVCVGREGRFFVNGKQVASLDLSARTGEGKIMLGVGFLGNDEISGETTRYENFLIWQLP